MAKRLLSNFLTFIAWITGVFVSLAVAFGMIDGVLTIRFIPHLIMVIFGWVVVATTLIGVIIGIVKLVSKPSN
jgi:hypothetical protein